MKHHVMNMLDKIDGFLEHKKESEKQIITFLPAALTIFLVYFYLFDPSVTALKKSQRELNAQKSTYQNYKIMLENNQMQQLIAQILDQKMNVESKIASAKDDIEGIKAQFIDIGYMQMEWNDALKYVSQKAKNQKITVEKVSTDVTKLPSANVFSASIKGGSPFKNIVEFLNDVESNDKFLRVSGGRMSLEKSEILFDVNITAKKVAY